MVRRKAMERDGYRCLQCGQAAADEVDHIKPIAEGGDHYDLGNLQSICRPCHAAKTARENDARLAARRAERYEAWLDAAPGRRAWIAATRGDL